MKVELRNQPTQRGDSIALTDAQYCDVETVCASFQCRNSIGNGASGVIVAVKLDAGVWIALSAKPYKLFNLAGCGDTGSIRQANALNARINDGIKDCQQIDQVTAERILSRKAHVAPSGPDAPDQWYGIVEYLIDAPAMTERA